MRWSSFISGTLFLAKAACGFAPFPPRAASLRGPRETIATQAMGFGDFLSQITGRKSKEGEQETGKFMPLGGGEDIGSFGPRCMLACGFQEADRAVLTRLVEEGGGAAHPILFVTDAMAKQTLGEVLDPDSMHEERAGQLFSLPDREYGVVLLSGYTLSELRSMVAGLRSALKHRPAVAKAVPMAMKKPVGQLLNEIASDHADALTGRLHSLGSPPTSQ
ncbi:unnamed protein product [Chrysoparadoxa australica]